MTTGERIEQLAKEKGMSLHKLATLAKVSYNTVYSAAKRKSNRIDMNILERLAAVLQVSISDLSGINYEEYADGTSFAVIDTDKLSPEVVPKLASCADPSGMQIGIPLGNDEEKNALYYLLENGNTSPEWSARLLTAFNKLPFTYQHMLINFAEDLVNRYALINEFERTEGGSDNQNKE